MAKLSEDEKAFVVCQFACFATPTQTCRAFTEQFGKTIDKKQADSYRVDGWRGRRAGVVDPLKKWRPLFEETRAKFLEEAAAIPIANGAFRLAKLQEMFEKAMTGGARPNIPLAAQLLEQAAKESGGSFTNKREHSHKGKIETEDRTPEEKRGMIEQRIGAFLDRAVQAAAASDPPTQH